MTAPATAVPDDMTLREVAELFGRARISGGPVLNGHGRLVGVVSETDIAEATLHAPRARGKGGTRAGVASRTARDVMSSPAITVEPDRQVSHAAMLMIGRGIKRLPVVEAGRLVGIVTHADLVRAFDRDDAAIRAEIWSDVVLRGVFVNPRHLEVNVEAGEVTITGEVETRGKAERLIEYVELVPGVTAVHADVTWRLGDGPPKGVPRARRR